jgi:hypothetical protein
MRLLYCQHRYPPGLLEEVCRVIETNPEILVALAGDVIAI